MLNVCAVVGGCIHRSVTVMDHTYVVFYSYIIYVRSLAALGIHVFDGV